MEDSNTGTYRKSMLRNPLLRHPGVGQQNRPICEIPKGIVFGAPSSVAQFSVKDVMQSWCEHRPSPNPRNKTDFTEINLDAIKVGCKSKKDMAEFRRKNLQNPDYKGPHCWPKKYVGAPDNVVFGRSNCVEDRVSLEGILTNKFQKLHLDKLRIKEEWKRAETQENKKRIKERTRKMLLRMMTQSQKKVTAEEPKKFWKMSKFSNVKSKTDSGQGGNRTLSEERLASRERI